MKYFICNFSKDWSDEFDVQGSQVFTETEKAEFETRMADLADRTVDLYFGTNEGWEDEEVSEFSHAYKFVEITESTFTELREKFPHGFGMFYDVTKHISGEEEDW